MQKEFTINTLQAKDIRSQVLYANSPVGFKTAQNIVSAKLRNCHHLLTNYRQAKERAGFSEEAQQLAKIQEKLAFYRNAIDSSPDARNLFILEAQAAKQYWRGISLITKQNKI